MPQNNAKSISIKLASHLDRILNLCLKSFYEEVSVMLKVLMVYNHNISQCSIQWIS